MSGKKSNTGITFNNIRWEVYRSILIPDEPPHLEISLKQEECHELLLHTNAWMIRWPSQWDKKEVSAFWYVIKDHYKGFADFSRNTRSKIRRGMKRNDVRKIEIEELKKQGYLVYERAFSRYARFCKSLNADEFLKRLNEMDSDQYEFWGVYNDGVLVAYAEIKKLKEVINTSVLKFHPAYLGEYTSYALFYSLIKHYLRDDGVKYITNGARSISHDTNIQSFLIEQFNFRRAYCKLNIFYKHLLGYGVQIAYPFRKLTGKLPGKPFKKLDVLLAQEFIRRNS